VNLALFEAEALALFLHLVRTAAFLAVVPFFGRLADTLVPRVVLALALASVFWWVGDHGVAVPRSLPEFGLAAVREAFAGVALGFALGTLTAALVAAGEIISTEMGFAMARAMDPDSGVEATVMSQLYQIVGFLLILQFDLHHEALRILGQTFRACPVGQPFELRPIWDGVSVLVGAGIVVALQYALPVLAVMLLLTVGLVLLGRAVPHINLMEFSFAARALLALLAAAFFLTEGAPFLLRSFAGMLQGARAMFPAG
jgi:flagellar biosynthetic protein FliR